MGSSRGWSVESAIAALSLSMAFAVPSVLLALVFVGQRQMKAEHVADRGMFTDGWHSVGHVLQGVVDGILFGMGLLSGRRCSRFVRSWCCTVGALQALLYLVYDFAKSRTFAENIYNRRDGVLTNLAFTNFYASLREVCVGILAAVAATAVVLARLSQSSHGDLDVKSVPDTEFQEGLLEFETIQ